MPAGAHMGDRKNPPDGQGGGGQGLAREFLSLYRHLRVPGSRQI
jgi:hypothetical protein